jgi:DivIVA domain-containing protein
MELSPQSVSSTTFKIVKRGYDPDEVRAYLGKLSASIESMQNQTAAMEARARAAVARLQEIAAQTPPQPQASEPVVAGIEEAETISRTLLLAQRTADQTIAEAESRAQSITEDAESEARRSVEGAQEAAARMVEDAKNDARKAGEAQRVQVESEVQSLLARREFLLSDVDHLEQHIVTQRDRLRDVASALVDIVERVPGGLGDLRRPLVSAVEAGNEPRWDDGSDPDATMPMAAFDTPEEAAGEDATEAPAETAAEHDTVEEVTTADDAVIAESVADGAGASANDSDWTPPEGVASQFPFDDVTREVPATGSTRDDA